MANRNVKIGHTQHSEAMAIDAQTVRQSATDDLDIEPLCDKRRRWLAVCAGSYDPVTLAYAYSLSYAWLWRTW